MNALLMEILLAVLFFALSSAVILQLFVTGYDLSARADALDRAVNHARQISERLYAAENMPTALVQSDFEEENGVWRLAEQDYVLEATLEEEEMSAGRLCSANIVAYVEGETATALSCARYFAEEARL